MELPLDGAIQPWRRAGKRLIIYYKAMLRSVAAHFGVSTETPYKDLPEDFKKVLLHGSGEDDIEFKFWRAGKVSSISRPFEGVLRIWNVWPPTAKANSSATGSGLT